MNWNKIKTDFPFLYEDLRHFQSENNYSNDRITVENYILSNNIEVYFPFTKSLKIINERKRFN